VSTATVAVGADNGAQIPAMHSWPSAQLPPTQLGMHNPGAAGARPEHSATDRESLAAMQAEPGRCSQLASDSHTRVHAPHTHESEPPHCASASHERSQLVWLSPRGPSLG
jgi:hypothetical protein